MRVRAVTRLLALAALLATCHPLPVTAAPPPKSMSGNAACTRATKLAAGATAPCAGELLPTSVVAELLRTQDLSRQLASDLTLERENAAAATARAASDRATAATEAAGVLAACERHRDDCEARVIALAPGADTPGPSWWTVVGVGAVGVLVGVLAGALAL